MNTTTLKSDFYKRFDTSNNPLIIKKSGLLCTLLGFCNIKGASSLSTVLSMGVSGICRRLDGNAIQITDTSNSDTLTYHLDNKSKKYNICGSQILFDNSIPLYIPSSSSLRTCILKCILSTSKIDNFDKLEACLACCGKENIKPYLALMEAKKGYAVFSHKLESILVPLPMTGYKYILIQFCDKKTLRSHKDTERALDIINTSFPYAKIFSDLNSKTMQYAATKIKNRRTLKKITYLVNETKRINCALTALQALHTETLFDIINESAKEYTLLWDNDNEIEDLLDFAMSCDGVMTARPFNRGILCIVREDMCNHVTNTFSQILKYNLKNNIRFCISE